jgi:hypothetical protein
MKKFKKLKLLSSPVQIPKARLDELEYDTAPLKEAKIDQLRVRRWHHLRREIANLQG